VRFLRSVCLGMVCFVVIAMFAAHGSVQTFAEGAVSVGFAWALLGVAGRLLVRVPWRDVIGVAAITMFVSSLLDDVRVLPRRWR